jgi:hypothetical protein
MRVSINFALPLAALLFGLLLVPQAALAQAHIANCPKEPVTGTPIASGDVYAGSQCELYAPGDVDSFVFNADAGDTWQIIVGYQGGYGTCMALHDPNGKEIFPNTCTGTGQVFDSQTLTVTGQYTINLSMEGNGTSAEYALSLERINPFPADAQSIALKQVVDGSLSSPTEQQTHTFYGATTGTYQVSVSYTGGYGTCIYLYYPGSATPQPSPDQGCTGTGIVQFTFTPPRNSTYMVLLFTEGDGTGSYSLEVSCYLGTCPIKEPTTTSLTSKPNPSTDGQKVTFTAVVSSSEGAPPNGETVSFMNGKTVLGPPEKLSDGKATFSDSTLPAGATTSVTAVYSGDSNFQGSTSNKVEQVVYGPCTLTDSLSYSATSKTLTMKFTVGNIVATTWNVWLTYENKLEELFSASQPITNPPVPVTKTATLSSEGTIGVLSTLTTPTGGIYCSSYVQIPTGTP